MTDTLDFSDKVVLVTGAGSGIGEACAKEFASRGGKVVIADFDLPNAERVVREISEVGGAALAVKVDVADPASVDDMVRSAVASYGRLDVAVNNAGIGGESKLTGDYSVESWNRVIDVNLNGVFYCMKAEISAMLSNGGGAIVNMASILGWVGFASSSAYVAAKHGVLGLTQSSAIEYATQGIRINSVGPGFIATPLLSNNLDEAATKAIGEMHAMKRMGTPAEVSALVCFLASDAASFITGSYHVVDGGYTAQ